MKAAVCLITLSVALLQFCNGQDDKRLQESDKPNFSEADDVPGDAGGGGGPPPSTQGAQRFLGGQSVSPPKPLTCGKYLGYRFVRETRQ